MSPKILVSTTSFKKENFLEILDVYESLGWKSLDVNLHPFLFESESAGDFIKSLQKRNFRVGFTSGGWCDFFHKGDEWKKTEAMVEKQAIWAKALGASSLRLFFGRLEHAHYNEAELANVVKNISSIAKRHTDLRFSFENHDGVSLDPVIVSAIIRAVDLPNVGITFDPVNYAKASVNALAALPLLFDKIFHVHVKGLTKDKHYCEYGVGEFDYQSILKELKRLDYRGNFTLEYEGENNPIIKLASSLKNLSKSLSEFEFKS